MLYVMTLETMLSLQSADLASHTTAATVSDTVSRLPGGTEQASDAACAHTKEEDSLDLLRLPEEAYPIDLDTAITIMTPEKLGFCSRPRRPN